MKIKFTAATILLLTALLSGAQGLTEVKNIRIYDHHSTDMTDKPLGMSADGKQSGYDFIKKAYISSFDPETMDSYSKGEEQNIDLVEHNGPFGTNGASSYLGFTSGVSTIWGGDIEGNGTTKWMKAPSGFTYSGATKKTDLSNAWSAAAASTEIAEVKMDEIYIGKIRNQDIYVVMRCTSVKMAFGGQGQNDNIYFQFDYKITEGATGIGPVGTIEADIYPNPASDFITISSKTGITATLYSLAGAEMHVKAASGRLDIRDLEDGVYFLSLKNDAGETLTRKVVKSSR